MNKLEKLVAYLEKCDEAYYVQGKPIVSNETYEALVASLQKLDPHNEYLSKVGTKIQGNGKAVGRLVPMGTLGKLNKPEEVKVWWEKQPAHEFLLCPKYDGFACELDYIDGKFKMGSTRGDGTVGEDVTDAAIKIVPLDVPVQLTRVRGEFIIPKENHAKMKELGYKAMRNAVPGIIRSNSEEAVPLVHFIAYEFFDDNNDRINQRAMYSKIFMTEDSVLVDSFEAANAIRDHWIATGREEFDYEVDGLVLKTREILRDDLAHPEHSVSWKFKSGREATTLKGVRVQMGVTGKLAPVGDFEPVEFQGATLTTASLGSYGRLKGLMEDEENPIKIGSIVEVSRRGDIIPYIEEVTYTPDDAQELYPLTNCPHCMHPVEFRGEEPYCVNNSCPQLLNLQVQQFVANTGTKGIGGGLISRLCGGMINSLSDIYKINADDLAQLPRVGQSMVDKWKGLQEKEMTPLQFVSCLPFDGIGPAVWKQLLENLTVHEVMYLPLNDLLEMKLSRFGEGKRKDFIAQRNALLPEIEELLNLVNITGQ